MSHLCQNDCSETHIIWHQIPCDPSVTGKLPWFQVDFRCRRWATGSGCRLLRASLCWGHKGCSGWEGSLNRGVGAGTSRYCVHRSVCGWGWGNSGYLLECISVFFVSATIINMREPRTFYPLHGLHIGKCWSCRTSGLFEVIYCFGRGASLILTSDHACFLLCLIVTVLTSPFKTVFERFTVSL